MTKGTPKEAGQERENKEGGR